MQDQMYPSTHDFTPRNMQRQMEDEIRSLKSGLSDLQRQVNELRDRVVARTRKPDDPAKADQIQRAVSAVHAQLVQLVRGGSEDTEVTRNTMTRRIAKEHPDLAEALCVGKTGRSHFWDDVASQLKTTGWLVVAGRPTQATFHIGQAALEAARHAEG